MPEAFIGLGSNLSSQSGGIHKNPRNQVTDAIKTITKSAQMTLVAVSSFYQTAAIGPGDQPDYINAAITIETSLDAYALLEVLQQIENQQGRVRKEHWGARTLDLDILVYGQSIVTTAQLTLPHPRAHERAFVLAPLADLNPNLSIPGHGVVSDLLAKCSMKGIVKLEN
jgi:2-amino-4-hydroxy-6-hydroxymethyldihydropteridine diphosphokinase